MKCLKNNAIIAFLIICVLHSYAQDPAKLIHEPNYNRSRIFNDLPERMNLRVKDVAELVNLPVGSPVNTFAATNFRISGNVISTKEDKDAGLKTVVIKLNNRQGAIFTFTKQVKEDGTTSYVGRILNRNNGDAFDLVKENGQYTLVKKGVYDLISE